MFTKFIPIALIIVFTSCSCVSAGRLDTTKHNLSVSGASQGNDIYSSSEDEVCIFCHTPHNANPAVPLWNHYVEGSTVYQMYGSDFPAGHSSLEYSSIPSAPTGSSKLCLSCHDGTVAVGLLQGGTTIPLTDTSGSKLVDGKLASQAILGTLLTNDHPISIPIQLDSTDPLNDELELPGSSSPVKLENGLVQCSSCHDPHYNDPTIGKFLVMSPGYGALCEECHDHNLEAGLSYTSSAHGQTADIWPTDDDVEHPLWAERKPVNEWACLGCHEVHGDDSAEVMPHLLRSKIAPQVGNLIDEDKETEACVNCHNGPVTAGASTVAPDIRAEFEKAYTHPIEAHEDQHYVKEFEEAFLVSGYQDHVECVDCHDPHYSQSRSDLDRPRPIGEIVAGPELKGVRGWEFLGFLSSPNAEGLSTSYGTDDKYLIQYEYELCLKCHGSKAKMDFERDHMERMDDHFNPYLNMATHGVMAPSGTRNPYVYNGASPEFQAAISNIEFDAGATIACSDCHGNDSTDPNRILGPHGSNWGAESTNARWLLRKAPVADDYGADFVCYLCHDVNVYGADPTITRASDINPTDYPDAYRSGFPYHILSKHQEKRVGYPPGIPEITCFACHGDYSNLITSPTTGGLHGANPRIDRPDTTSGVHFLNGFAIEIISSDAELLSTTGSITCGDYFDGTYGCDWHTTRSYSRPGL